MAYYIIIKQVADSEAIVCEDGKPKPFTSIKKAIKYADKNVKGRLTVWWDVIDYKTAKRNYSL